MLHVVSYDLRNPGQNYHSLITTIKHYDHVHINGSCWVLRTNLTATQLRNILTRSIDTSDNLIVCDFHNWAGYNLPPEVITWLKR